MREDQVARDSRGAPSSATPAVPEEKPPATVLIYSDGHQMEETLMAQDETSDKRLEERSGQVDALSDYKLPHLDY